MSLAHAAQFNVEAVLARVDTFKGPLWAGKIRDIHEARCTMYDLLAMWCDSPSLSDARSRLRKEMEERVDQILYRSFDLHDLVEQGEITMMLWERNSSLYDEARAKLPGGKYFYICAAAGEDAGLREAITFRVTRLLSMPSIIVERMLFEDYRDRIGRPALPVTIRSTGALCASQKPNSDAAITLYFDSEEDAVYAKCLI